MAKNRVNRRDLPQRFNHPNFIERANGLVVGIGPLLNFPKVFDRGRGATPVLILQLLGPVLVLFSLSRNVVDCTK